MSLVPRHSIFDLDSIFENNWLPFKSHLGERDVFSPRVDVKETDNNYEISAELPGVNKEDVHVTLNDGVLTIEAETHNESKEEKEGRVIRHERRYGKFFRSFDLGAQIQESDIVANFDNGVLMLTAPKLILKAEDTKQIPIH